MTTTISLLDSVILGVVEGLTEFLPVSSTGHLKITEGLLDIPVDDPAVVGFTAVIQVGAIAAVLVYFFGDIVRLLRAWGRGLVNPAARAEHDYKFAWWVIFATIPIVDRRPPAQDLIKGPLASLWIVAGSLIVGSGVMWLAEWRGTQKRGEQEITFTDSMLVGSSQILALLFPGFSRSGGDDLHLAAARPGPGHRDAVVVLPVDPGADGSRASTSSRTRSATGVGVGPDDRGHRRVVRRRVRVGRVAAAVRGTHSINAFAALPGDPGRARCSACWPAASWNPEPRAPRRVVAWPPSYCSGTLAPPPTAPACSPAARRASSSTRPDASRRPRSSTGWRRSRSRGSSARRCCVASRP